MNQVMKQFFHRFGQGTLPKSLLILAAALTLIGWLWFTPPGILGKADAVGYAVCHRIAVRSFFFGDRQFPICARCSGMYLGAFVGMLYYARERKSAGMPTLKMSVVLVAFLAFFGIDGINSYLHFFPQLPSLYQPENWLRLLTGTGVGLGIASILIPIVRQTLWSQWDAHPALSSWRQLAELILLGGIVDVALLSENPLILFPLALVSTATILIILTLVYTLLWIMITKRENAFHSWKEAWLPVVAGFTTALLQIAVMDAARYALTGTWDGFNLTFR
jgi:uncharacterized membrane protein